MDAGMLIGLLPYVIIIIIVIWIKSKKANKKNQTPKYDTPTVYVKKTEPKESKSEPVKPDKKEEPPAEKKPDTAPGKEDKLIYSRDVRRARTEKTVEREWESDDIYSYTARRDIWRCRYCDAENDNSDISCCVCGEKRC